MDLLQGVVLGVIQGLTEFLPISSTAHLRIFPALVGWPDPGAAFSAVVQLGTLLAVLAYFRRDIWQMARAWGRGVISRHPWADTHSRLAWLIILGTVPIGVAGLFFEKSIEHQLRSLWVVAGALVALALILFAAELIGRRRRGLEEISLLDAAVIGLAQALALVPGASRSGVTITAGLFVGLRRADAARFSFLLSVPAVAASGLYEAIKLLRMPALEANWTQVTAATISAAVSGYLAIAWLMRLLQKHSTAIFIAYRVALGLAIVLLLSFGVLAS